MSLHIPDPVIGAWAKSFPPRAHGLRVSEVGDAGLRLSEFATPVLTLHASAIEHNERAVFGWAARHGLLVAPHGKTTMAPALWQRLLDAGAWALTVATVWQASAAVAAGVRRVFLANIVVDPAAIAHLGTLLAEHADLTVLCWADSVAAVELLAEGLDARSDQLGVLVEMGGDGGRTGARTIADGEAVAAAIGRAGLRLAGVAGYEGPFGSDRGSEALARVDSYLASLVELHRRLVYPVGVRPVLSAGGSAFPDRVAAIFGSERDSADVVLRSGAFQIHDDGFYRRVSPLGALPGSDGLRSAMHVWAHVLSHPEPHLALVDAGKRDVSFDLGMPELLDVAGKVIALNDQHAFVRVDDPHALDVGQLVRLGPSHPCTVLDRWRLIPVVDDPDAEDPAVIDAVVTMF